MRSDVNLYTVTCVRNRSLKLSDTPPPPPPYGSPVWWTGKKGHCKELERVQNKALRRICGAFSTTPISALQLEAALPPINLHLNYLQRRAAFRINRLPQNSQVICRLPRAWHENWTWPTTDPTTHQHQRRPNTQLLRLSRLSSPLYEHADIFAIEPWAPSADSFEGRLTVQPKRAETTKKAAARAHLDYVRGLNTDNNHLVVYTDGSQLTIDNTRRCGAAAVFLRRGRELPELTIVEGLGKNSEVYDAEMAALDSAAWMAVLYAPETPVRHIHFFADNNAAIQSIFSGRPAAAQRHSLSFRTAIIHFLNKNPTHTVEIAWSPGHTDIPGNERADKLAKQAVRIEVHKPHTRTHSLRMAKEQLLDDWKKIWLQSSRYGGFAPANRFPPSLKPRKHFTQTGRELFTRLTQCRTGHAFVGEYYRRFVPHKDPSCPCGEDVQTRKHIIQDCPLFDEGRFLLCDVSPSLSLTDLLGTTEGIVALTRYIRRTGAFKKCS